MNKNSIIHILSCGPSITQFQHDGCRTLGVHYITAWHPCDRIYIQDYPDTFTEDKLHTILHSKPEHGFVMYWDFHRGPFQGLASVRTFNGYVYEAVRLDDPGQIPLGPSAGFSAAAFAAWERHLDGSPCAQQVVVWGCDYITHSTHQDNLPWIRQHWKWLRDDMSARGQQLWSGPSTGFLVNDIKLQPWNPLQ